MIRKKVVWLPYDFDTALGINNEGALTFSYNLEDTDRIAGDDGEADVFNGQSSVVWNNIRRAFNHELQVMYRNLRSQGVLSYETVERMFEEHQDKWSEAIFNEDAWFKYIAPLVEEGSASYLSMAQGSKEEQRKWWLYNRFRYIDSKYKAGDALSDLIQIRGYAKSNVTVTPYADIYPTVKYGSATVRQRGQRNVPTTLVCPLDNVNDTEIYIYSASQLASVGDLSGFKVGFADFSKATKLQSIKVGDASSSYSNANLKELYVGNNSLLQTVDVRNCGGLNTSVDLSGAANIEHVYFDGTAVTSVSLPVGGILKTLHLPATVTNLTVRNQPSITDFTMPSYEGITTLRIENSPAIPVEDILADIPANSRVRLIGLNLVMTTTAEVEEFYDFLDTMRGLDEAGNNTDHAVVSGTISGLGSIDGSWLAQMLARYPSIEITGTAVSSTLRYYNYDGTVLLHSETIEGRGDGTYAGTPERADDAQYDYTFVGWNLARNQTTADPNATRGIMGDRNVYAAYSAAVRSYTVTWLDDDESVLATETYAYGQTPDYGVMPSKHGVTALGWEPEVAPVTGDATYTAKYGYRVRFYNGTTLLKQVNNVSPGTTVQYIDSEHPSNPEKANHRFDGWSPAIAAVTSDVDYYATFVRLYTVRFYNSAADIGGTALKTVSNIDAGTSIADIIAEEAPTPTAPAHKVFEAWSPASGQVNSDTDIAATYYDIYSVEFYNDPEAVSPLYTVNGLRSGETAVYAGTTPSVEGKDFTGVWIPSNVVNPANADANNIIKCYAQYADKHLVRFLNVDGSHVLETKFVSHGERAEYTGNAFEHPYNSVLQFLGWNPNPNTTVITADTDFVAQYEASYTVRFYSDAGKTDLLKTVTYVESGGNAAYGADPTKAGYRFNGWSPSNMGITADTDCVAQWVAVYNVVFMNQSGSTELATVTVDSGTTAVYPNSDPVNTDGTTFLGWASSANQHAAVSGILDNITANKTVYAAHNPLYTVIFQNMDGTELTRMNVEKGHDASYGTTPVHPHNSALTFTGWNPSNLNITANTTCVAQYETSYTVTFKNGTTTLQTLNYVKSGTNVTYSGTTPTNADNTTFLGWAASSDAAAADSAILNNITADKTVYAVFNPAYTVTFKDQSGASTLQTKKVEKGANAAYTGNTPTNTAGTAFLGWAASANATAADSTILNNITADKTVYAAHKAAYTVSFYNGSTLITTKTVEEGGTAVYDGATPVDPDGGEFLGWAASAGQHTADASILANIMADKSVYAAFSSMYEDAEITDSWETIIASVEDGTYATKYKIGNYKPLDLGTEGIINMTIAAFDTDDLAGDSGKAPITMIAKELLATSHAINSENTNEGGWADSEMRSYLETDILPLIPSVVAGNIKPVRKYSKICSSGTIINDSVSEDVLWIPSSREANQIPAEETAGPKYDYRTIKSTHHKAGESANSAWWLRSVKDTTRWRCLYYKGTYSDYSPTDRIGVLLCFCLAPKHIITDSWSDILASESNGTYSTKYQVGDFKPLDLGTEGVVNMKIAAFDADELADDSGNNAPITWVAGEALTTQHPMSSGDEDYQWDTSEMKTYLAGTVKPLIPTEVRSALKTVKKYTYSVVSGSVVTNKQSTDDVWIPSCREVGLNTERTGPAYSLMFTDDDSRKKHRAGQVGESNVQWWLRSTHQQGVFIQVKAINSTGGLTNFHPYSINNGGYIVLGFCT